MKPVLVETIKLSKSFTIDCERNDVIDELDLKINSNEFLCILGYTGCGKSTLLRILAGFESPDEGDVLIAGTSHHSPTRDVIMIFQDYNQLFPWKTALGNVVYAIRTVHRDIPYIGFGTAGVRNPEELKGAICMSIQYGYKLIDTANGYHNETIIGQALKELGIARADYFLTSKLDDDAHSFLGAKQAVFQTLKRLQTDYLDLFLIHVPNSERMKAAAEQSGNTSEVFWEDMNIDAWRGLEWCVQNGYVRSIGVSNFSERHLRSLLGNLTIKPLVNQIKLCAGCYSAQAKTISYCRDEDIVIQAYRPLGKGVVLKHPLLLQLASSYNKTPAQIALRFLYQQNFCSVVSSTNSIHLRENLDIFSFKLSTEDCEKLKCLRINDRLAMIKDPDSGKMYN